MIKNKAELKIIDGVLYVQGKILNNILDSISEIYQQYVNHHKDYNPKAKFPEEISVLFFVDETYFPVLWFQYNPFKIVVGMKLEE